VIAMQPTAAIHVSRPQGHRVGFLAVVALGFLGVLGTGAATQLAATWAVSLPAAVVYLLLGALAFPRLLVAPSRGRLAGYFAVQIALALWLVTIAGGGLVVLIWFPLLAQAVEVSRWHVLAVSAAVVLASAGYSWSVGGLQPALRSTATGLLVTSFVVFYASLARRERQARERLDALTAQIEEASAIRERDRLAQELHDSLGHHLTVISMQLEAAKAVMASDPGRCREAMQRAQDMARDALTAVTRTIQRLGAAMGAALPLQMAVLVAQASGAVRGSFAVRGEEREVGAATGDALLRSTREALINVYRHATGASAAAVTLTYEPGAVRVVVADDGAGAGALREGLGLRGIRERIERLGGRVGVTTSSGAGFALEMEVPGG